MDQKVWKQATDLYNHFTLHICPGPRSVSYLSPFLALFFVLLIPPHLLSLRQIRTIILPVVYAFQLHVWYRHDSFDVISTNNALALFMLLGYYDVRTTFKLVHRDRNQSLPTSAGNRKVTDTAMPQPHLLEPYPPNLGSRLPWVLHLCSSLRLTDWHIGIPFARQISAIVYPHFRIILPRCARTLSPFVRPSPSHPILYQHFA